MWKVVVTEIQDASALEPSDVPPGAFFVSTERFATTVEDLDLQALIDTINRMQSSQRDGRQERRLPVQKVSRKPVSSRSESLREAHKANLESPRATIPAAQLLSKTDS